MDEPILRNSPSGPALKYPITDVGKVLEVQPDGTVLPGDATTGNDPLYADFVAFPNIDVSNFTESNLDLGTGIVSVGVEVLIPSGANVGIWTVAIWNGISGSLVRSTSLLTDSQISNRMLLVGNGAFNKGNWEQHGFNFATLSYESKISAQYDVMVRSPTGDPGDIQLALDHGIGNLTGGSVYLKNVRYELTDSVPNVFKYGTPNVRIYGGPATIIDYTNVSPVIRQHANDNGRGNSGAISIGVSRSPSTTLLSGFGLYGLTLEDLRSPTDAFPVGDKRNGHLLNIDNFNDIEVKGVTFNGGFGERYYGTNNPFEHLQNVKVVRCNFISPNDWNSQGPVSGTLNPGLINDLLVSGCLFYYVPVGPELVGSNIIVANNRLFAIRQWGIYLGEDNDNTTTTLTGCLCTGNVFGNLGNGNTTSAITSGIIVPIRSVLFNDGTASLNNVISNNTFTDSIFTGGGLNCISVANGPCSIIGNVAGGRKDVPGSNFLNKTFITLGDATIISADAPYVVKVGGNILDSGPGLQGPICGLIVWGNPQRTVVMNGGNYFDSGHEAESFAVQAVNVGGNLSTVKAGGDRMIGRLANTDIAGTPIPGQLWNPLGADDGKQFYGDNITGFTAV